MRVWKVGSRWSEWGDPNTSVKDIFVNNNIFFVGSKAARDRVSKEVKIGDIVALADGIRIVAIGLVESSPRNLSHYNINDKIEHLHNDIRETLSEGWAMAVRTRFYPLSKEDQFEYTHREFIEVVSEDYKKKVINLYGKYADEFSIEPKIAFVKDIVKCNFQIPVYQRPYSWPESMVEKFIYDLFNHYWGFNRDSLPEPMFIGTMQLSAKVNSCGYFEVIDGQQRMTTLLLLLYVLSRKFPNQFTNIDFNWLNTKVNNGSQQQLLLEVFSANLAYYDNKQITNPYLRNAYKINTLIDNVIEQDSDSLFEEFDSEYFADYLLKKVSFVQIAINAGLTKTLKVFDTINTTGLSLAGSDIFKLKMYEYLNNEDNAFEKINDVYARVEQKNKENNCIEANISQILSLYQQVLISKYEMPVVLYDYNNDRFFDELFDAKFGIANYPNFTKVIDIKLDLDEMSRLIEIRFQWVNGYYTELKLADLHTTLDYCVSHQIGWSRYSRYWNLRFHFVYCFPNDVEKLPLFMRLVSSYLLIYSLLFEKTVYHAHSTIRKLLVYMYKENTPVHDVIEFLRKEIKQEVPTRGNPMSAIERILNEDIVYSTKKKNIVCRLSAMFDEDGLDSSSFETIKPIIRKLYNTSIDIEHIHASADRTLMIDDNLQNSIGNLVILEYDLNRSLGKKTYSEKRKEYKKRSQFASVLKIAENHEEWGIVQIEKRREIEIDKILNYIFNN